MSTVHIVCAQYLSFQMLWRSHQQAHGHIGMPVTTPDVDVHKDVSICAHNNL